LIKRNTIIIFFILFLALALPTIFANRKDLISNDECAKSHSFGLLLGCDELIGAQGYPKVHKYTYANEFQDSKTTKHNWINLAVDLIIFSATAFLITVAGTSLYRRAKNR
jgi:hypothetical protein